MTNTKKNQVNTNKFKAVLIFGLIGLIYSLVNPFLPQIEAQTMSNDNYIIKMQDFNTVSGTTANESYELRSGISGLSQTTSEGADYKVKTGIENLVSPVSFSISLSSDIVNFGILNPTNPIIRTIDLSINSLAVYGHSVLVFENSSLTASSSANNAFIPDVTCDDGKCDVQSASEWKNALSYGFGYRCDNIIGADCDNSFTKANYYKRFSNSENNEIIQSIMAGIGSSNKKIRISYKVNISGSQAQSNYNNIITYIGIPNF
jgi:hypothetical protein